MDDRVADRSILLHAVSKRYGANTVLQSLDLEIRAGECVALLGHNGAGKTTLMKLLLGLTRASSGRIRIGGADPAHSLARGLDVGIGFLPENVAFLEAMSGREVLAFYARLKRRPLRECDSLLERVGLSLAARRRVRTYSKGMRQRLGLAQALLGAPRILLLDEPTSGLDPALRLEFYKLVREHQAEGATALISSHALTEIEARTDRVAILRGGRLVACGSLGQLRAQAGLPIQIRVTTLAGRGAEVAAALGTQVQVHRVEPGAVDLSCTAGDKLEVISALMALRALIEDFDVAPPGLDQIYAYFSAEGQPR